MYRFKDTPIFTVMVLKTSPVKSNLTFKYEVKDMPTFPIPYLHKTYPLSAALMSIYGLIDTPTSPFRLHYLLMLAW